MSAAPGPADLIQIECDQETSKLGVLIAFGGIIMLFVTFLTSFSSMLIKELAYIKLDTIIQIVASVSTTILIISSIMFNYAYRQWQKNNTADSLLYLASSAILGVLFLIGQISLWQMLVNDGLTSSGNVLAGMVYLIGGTHAVHLVTGLVILGWLWFQVKKRYKVKPVRYQLIGWFWHFLTVLWCLIFVFFLIIL